MFMEKVGRCSWTHLVALPCLLSPAAGEGLDLSFCGAAPGMSLWPSVLEFSPGKRELLLCNSELLAVRL